MHIGLPVGQFSIHGSLGVLPAFTHVGPPGGPPISIHVGPPGGPPISIHVGPPGGPPIDSVAGQVSHEAPASPVAKTLVGRELQKQNQSELQEIESIRQQIKEDNETIDHMYKLMNPDNDISIMPMSDPRYIGSIQCSICQLFDRIKKINDSEQRNNLDVAIKNLAHRAGVSFPSQLLVEEDNAEEMRRYERPQPFVGAVVEEDNAEEMRRYERPQPFVGAVVEEDNAEEMRRYERPQPFVGAVVEEDNVEDMRRSAYERPLMQKPEQDS